MTLLVVAFRQYDVVVEPTQVIVLPALRFTSMLSPTVWRPPEIVAFAAATAPPQMQSRLYQQAAYKALDEGDTTRARQIATDHLPANVRDSVMQRIDFRELTAKADGARLEDIRQMVARAQSDDD